MSLRGKCTLITGSTGGLGPCTGISGRSGEQHEDYPWSKRVEASPLLLDPRVTFTGTVGFTRVKPEQHAPDRGQG